MKTIAEIIEELKEYPSDIFAWGWDDGSIIIEDKDGNEIGLVETGKYEPKQRGTNWE